MGLLKECAMSNVPPIPSSPIGEGHAWRDWFNFLRQSNNGNTTNITTINGQLSNSNANVLNISGDATGTGSGALTLILNTVNSSPGTYNGITVNSKGLVTNIIPTSSSSSTGSMGIPGSDGEDGQDGMTIVGPAGPQGPAGASGTAVNSNVISSPISVATDTSYVVVSYLNNNSTITNNGNIMVL